MGQGQGSITSNKKQDPTGAPSPPFALNSAFNGLSVDTVTGQIVFGQDVGAVGDPAAFVSDREIPMSFFDLTLFLNNSADAFAALRFNNDPVNPTGNIGSVQPGGDNGATLNWQGGDPLGASPLMQMQAFTLNTVLAMAMLNDEISTAQLGARYDDGVSGNQTGMLIDFFNQVWEYGDVTDTFNGNKLIVDDGTQQWGIGQRTLVQNLLLNLPAVGIGLSFFDSNGNNPFLLPDPGTGGIAFISAPDFSTQLALADAGSGSLAQLGDTGASTTGMTLQVDVPNSEVAINNTGGTAIVRINTVPGFTGVVAPVNTITVDGGIVTNVA
jgi:hypothetical protein